MSDADQDRLDLRVEEDMVRVRQAVRAWCVRMGFSLVDQTKMVTAASELARNTVYHGGGGHVTLRVLREPERTGLQLRFEDQGPGIADLEQAQTDGYSTGQGLGLGLGGARRLVNDFHIESEPGQGTRITITRWN